MRTALMIVLGIAFFILGSFIGNIYIIKPNKSIEVIKPQSNFEVVDKYQGCDLLRWSDSQLAEYKYVLYCPK